MASRTCDATARPSSGGTELPICLNPCHFVMWNRNQSGYEWRRAASRTVMQRGIWGCIGRGDVKAPRSLPVPARSVFDKPSGSSLRKRLIGSTLPCDVALNLFWERGVCSVRMLEVRRRGFQALGWEKSRGSVSVPRRVFAYGEGLPSFAASVESLSTSSSNRSTSGRSPIAAQTSTRGVTDKAGYCGNGRPFFAPMRKSL